MKNKIFGMDNKVAGKYALYFAGFAIGTFVIIKLIKNLGGGPDDSTPTPVEPTPSKKVGLTAQQNKIEELQSLLGVNPDHVVGPITKGAYGKLNLGLNISLSNNTSTADLQKIINAIVSKNKSTQNNATGTALRNRAATMVQSWAKNPTGVLSATKSTKLVVVNLDKTNNKYIATNQTYTYGTNDKFTREQLGVLKQAAGFNQPYYIIFKNSIGTTLLANPNDWIIK
jgi:hypothetical protein